MKGVVLNPVIFMTVIGLIVNVILTFGLHREDSDKLPSKPPAFQCCYLVWLLLLLLLLLVICLLLVLLSFDVVVGC